jgi:hypothetical protein
MESDQITGAGLKSARSRRHERGLRVLGSEPLCAVSAPLVWSLLRLRDTGHRQSSSNTYCCKGSEEPLVHFHDKFPFSQMDDPSVNKLSHGMGRAV